MFKVLVVVLVVVIVILVSVLYLQHQGKETVAQLKQLRQGINEKEIVDQLHKLDEANLSGRTKEAAAGVAKNYHEQVIEPLQQIDDQVGEAGQLLQGTKLFSSRGQLNDLAAELGAIQQTSRSISKDINELTQLQSKQQTAVATLGKQLQDFHQQFDDDGYQFGKSIHLLEKQLADLEGDYQHFVKMFKSGDYLAADELLKNLLTELTAFQQLVAKVPALYKPLLTVYPDQLKELRGAVEQLSDQHYNFVEDHLEDKIKSLQQEATTALEQLNQLQLGDVAHTNEHLKTQIDHYYDIMQREIDAREHVQPALDNLGSHLDHAQKQNDQLKSLLNRLSESYTFNNDELANTRELDEQLASIANQYQEDKAAVKDRTAVDSRILEHCQQGEKSLNDVEVQQQKINDNVAMMQEDEQRAQKAVKHFASQIKAIKRHAEALNLPGLSKHYLDYFFMVSDEIGKLNENIHAEKLNMDEITKQLLMVQSDMQTLSDKTDDLRDAALLTERLMQYANRLEDNDDVTEAAAEAQKYYDAYEYKKAMEEIATALEIAEPGTLKRIEDSYYNDVKNRTLMSD